MIPPPVSPAGHIPPGGPRRPVRLSAGAVSRGTQFEAATPVGPDSRPGSRLTRGNYQVKEWLT